MKRKKECRILCMLCMCHPTGVATHCAVQSPAPSTKTAGQAAPPGPLAELEEACAYDKKTSNIRLKECINSEFSQQGVVSTDKTFPNKVKTTCQYLQNDTFELSALPSSGVARGGMRWREGEGERGQKWARLPHSVLLRCDVLICRKDMPSMVAIIPPNTTHQRSEQ